MTKHETTLAKNGIRIVGNALPSSISDKARLILKIERSDGIRSIIAIPISVINSPAKMINTLLDAGLPHHDGRDWKEIQQLLQQIPEHQNEIVVRPGFHKHNYLSGDNKIIGKHDGKRPFLDPDAKLLAPNVSARGTLQEWQENVAIHCLHSTRIMLSICMAFAAYLTRWANIETGGFHLWGKSSIGKSCCLYSAISVYGSRESLTTWDTTSTAIEETASAHSDILLCLDELKLLHSNPAIAAQKATEIIYKLAAGQGKRRASSYQDMAVLQAQRWNTTALSTGEVSLADHAKAGGPARMLGEEVRVPDVPADAGKGLGIFESLSDGYDNSEELANSLDQSSRKYFGVAHRVFLEKLTEDLYQEETLVGKRISDRIEYFLKQNKIDRNCGHQVRLAKRFALAYAAGYFAIKYKVLNFDRRQVFKAISKCYQDTLRYRAPSWQDRIDEAYTLISNFVADAHYLDIRDDFPGYTDKQVLNAKRYIATVDNQTVRAIPLSCLQKKVGDKALCSAVIDRFRSENRLLKKSGGKNTRQILLPTGNGTKKRFICFLAARNASWS